MQYNILLPLIPPSSKIGKAKYAVKVGSIMYAMVETQIDIAFATSIVSRFSKNPSSGYFNGIDQILQFFAKSSKMGITFGRDEELKLVGYLNFNWAGNHAD